MEEYWFSNGREILKVFAETDTSTTKDYALAGMVGKFFDYGLTNYDVGHSKNKGLYEKIVMEAEENGKLVLDLPVYAYEYQGLELSLQHYTFRWNGKLAGHILVTTDNLKDAYGDENIAHELVIETNKSVLYYVSRWVNHELYMLIIQRYFFDEKLGGYIGSDFWVEASGLTAVDLFDEIDNMRKKYQELPTPEKIEYYKFK